MKTARLEKLMVFKAGTWHDQEYTIADLDAIVRSFKMFSEGPRPKGWRVPLVAGHDEQEALAAKEGQANLGLVDRCWREGAALYVDCSAVPIEVAELIKAGNFASVSVELFNDVRISDKVYDLPALRRVALCGADLAEVKGMLPPSESVRFSANGRVSTITMQQPAKRPVHRTPVDHAKAFAAELAEFGEDLRSLISITRMSSWPHSSAKDDRYDARQEIIARLESKGFRADASVWHIPVEQLEEFDMMIGDGVAAMPVPVARDKPKPIPDGVPGNAPAAAAPAGGTQVADQGLNGAQISALLDIADKVGTGALTQPAAAALIRAAFPLMSPANVDAIVRELHQLSPDVVETTAKLSERFSEKAHRMKTIRQNLLDRAADMGMGPAETANMTDQELHEFMETVSKTPFSEAPEIARKFSEDSKGYRRLQQTPAKFAKAFAELKRRNPAAKVSDLLGGK